jgi:hypothetical protein
MKYLITESKLKNLLIDKFGVDFTGDIKMITTVKDIPSVFLRLGDERTFKIYLNKFGPLYTIKRPKERYLVQPGNNNEWQIADENFKQYTQKQLLDKLEIPPIGISLNDIIELFVDEE